MVASTVKSDQSKVKQHHEVAQKDRHPEKAWDNHDNDRYLDTWAVHVKGGLSEANRVADEYGFENIGRIGSLADHYHFRHLCRNASSGCIPHHTASTHHTKKLHGHRNVHWAEQQKKLHRTKRSVLPQRGLPELDSHRSLSRTLRYVSVTDPLFSQQWFLERADGGDMNVRPAWEKGYTGKGVVVTVVDDGIEHTHDDLKDNYDASASRDVNDHDDDPFPNEADPINKHGTRCCGEVAAAKNDKCGVGIAFEASIGAVRMLDGDVTDAVEAESLSLNPQHIDIYSNSWGPNDDGRTIEGPAMLAQKAFSDGITYGRGGKGSIYVFASGNGGSSGDNCNCDGYCNSRYTIAIGAVTEHDAKPYYTEPCSATLAVAYSSGSGGDRSISTCDLHNGCTSSHSGACADTIGWWSFGIGAFEKSPLS